MIGALVPARFAFSNAGRVFDCPLCGGKGDLHLTAADNVRRSFMAAAPG
jgi:hypothetical protein